MYLSSKNKSRKQQLILVALFSAVCSSSGAFASDKVAPASATPSPAAAPAPDIAPAVTPAETPAAAEGKSAASEPTQPAEWVYNMRASLGAARSAKVSKEFSSDRLGAAVFAGHILPEVELSLGFAKTKDFTVGLSYHSFSGVEVASDKSWALQSIGTQARTILDLGLTPGLDIAAHAGVAVQVLVGEEQKSRQDSVKYGFAATGASFLRWSWMEAVYVLGGVDLTVGTASSFAASVGLETNF